MHSAPDAATALARRLWAGAKVRATRPENDMVFRVADGWKLQISQRSLALMRTFNPARRWIALMVPSGSWPSAAGIPEIPTRLVDSFCHVQPADDGLPEVGSSTTGPLPG